MAEPAHQRRALPAVRRLVVKVGSAVLAPQGVPDDAAFARLAADVAGVRASGVSVTLVSSGAVASGFRVLGFPSPPRTIVQKQAAAAVGQHRLMDSWARAFAASGAPVAQVLFTAEDLDHRARFLNARRTLGELLARGAVPIVNENDSVSFAEIRLGDNDRLSALAANLVDADLLLILSTVDGLHDARGRDRVVPCVRNRAEAEAHVRPDRSATGVGGMATKVEAASLAARWGIPTVVAGGRHSGVVSRVLAGEPIGTLFEARAARTGARKRWLGSSARSRGVIVVDEGAALAIVGRGASLLPSGIVSITGDFAQDATVDIAGSDGRIIARGLCAYSAADARKIAGRRSAAIGGILGAAYCDEVVHRNDLVVLAAPAG